MDNRDFFAFRQFVFGSIMKAFEVTEAKCKWLLFIVQGVHCNLEIFVCCICYAEKDTFPYVFFRNQNKKMLLYISFLFVKRLIFYPLLAVVVIWHIRNIMKWSMKWPNGNVLSRHTFYLWPYMVSCEAHQWSLNIRWRWCTPMCHWLHDITLSSNARLKKITDLNVSSLKNKF